MNLFAKYPGQPGRLFVALLLLLTVSPAVADNSEAMTRVEKFLASTQTLSAEFAQTLLDESGRVLTESEGTMAIKRPGRFRWHYKTPEELLVLGDGKQVWSYDVELENATVAAQDDTLSGNPASLLAGNSEATGAFKVTKTWRAGNADWIELAPRHAQHDFSAIRLGFANDVLVSMELHDQLGQTTRIVFDRVMQNNPLSDELFVFTVPVGVDVITAGGFSP